MALSAFRFFVRPTATSLSMAEDSQADPMVSNRSMLREFLASIATMSGDLSNITAPPFVLDTKSVVEIPSFWAENPSVFVSPAKSEDPVERSLLVLRSFLSGLRSQCYMGHTEAEGVKKPLNAFLGELFLGKWEDENGLTLLVSEQVSHHPPITACRVWNEKNGISAEGYNRHSITFNGSVNIHSTGHALKSIEKYDEHYLLPLPDFKVKGVLSGAPYPELGGTHYIPSTNGYMSVINFSGAGLFSSSSKKHSFTAHLFKEEEGESNPIYTIEGHWNTEFTIKDMRNGGKIIETFSVAEAVKKTTPLILPPVEEQDPWESHRAWKDTITGIKRNDMKMTSDSKAKIEQGQRNMRKQEAREGRSGQWETLFFKPHDRHDIVEILTAKLPGNNSKKSQEETTNSVWKFDMDRFKTIERPYHGGLMPTNRMEGEPTPPQSRNASIDSPRPSTSSQRPSTSSLLDRGAAATATRNVANQQTNNSRRDSRRDSKQSQLKGINHRLGAIEDPNQNPPPVIDGTKIDIGRIPEPNPESLGAISKKQPEPQTAQRQFRDEVNGSGIDGLSLNEKSAVEDMLRNATSSRK